jgi:hypothetical protein
MKSIHITFILIFCIFFYGCKTKSTFELIPSEDSGIEFNNQIVDNDTLNILTYEYLYNGSGVGLGDFNGDGLLDVFFSGSQVDSKLYLNQGDLSMNAVDLGGPAGYVGIRDFSKDFSLMRMSSFFNGRLSMALNNKKTLPVIPGKKSVTYDSFFLIIGNSEIRLKNQ